VRWSCNGWEKFASSGLAGNIRQEITTPEENNKWPIAVPCMKEKYNPTRLTADEVRKKFTEKKKEKEIKPAPCWRPNRKNHANSVIYGFFLTWFSQSSGSPVTKSSPSKTRERRRIEKSPQDRYIPTNQAAMILPI
jgi:hypothetical protein